MQKGTPVMVRIPGDTIPQPAIVLHARSEASSRVVILNRNPYTGEETFNYVDIDNRRLYLMNEMDQKTYAIKLTKIRKAIQEAQ